MKLLAISEDEVSTFWQIFLAKQETTFVRGRIALKKALEQNKFAFAFWFWGPKAEQLFKDNLALLTQEQQAFALVPNHKHAPPADLSAAWPLFLGPHDFLEWQNSGLTSNKKKAARQERKSSLSRGELKFRSLLHGIDEEGLPKKRKKLKADKEGLSKTERSSLVAFSTPDTKPSK